MDTFIKIENQFMTNTDVPCTMISIGVVNKFEVYLQLKIPYEPKELIVALRLLADKVDKKLYEIETAKYLD